MDKYIIIAQEILSHCKAVCEGRIQPPNGLHIYSDNKYDSFLVKGNGFRMELSATSHPAMIELAALLLGLTEPAPIVLEWVEGTEGVLVATFNHLICAKCIPVGDDGWCGYVYLDGTMMDECGISDLKNTQSWCLTTITELVTQKPTQK